ncbi:unnamed protein product [Arabis nemorensis]|uniref:Pectinesterase n=1 Tax=Arabis nemorensis TaxID=586526 RepID=A0A565BDC0_9BRAS|nr:unnamed protein product [Arabis nemorensis]
MLHRRTLSAPAMFYTEHHVQEQENNKNKGGRGLQEDYEILSTDSDKQEQQKKIQEDSEVLQRSANLIVAKDDSGNYKTINDAVKAAPNNSKTRFIIYVKEGIYDEIVRIASTKTNITLVGKSKDKTIITGSLNYVDHVKTFDSATLAVDGDGFLGQDICIRNTAGPEKHQAVALRVSGDNSILYLCRIEGYQDTLYADKQKQFYRECYITGTVDFIFGNAKAAFQKCHIEARKPLLGQENVITAQKRENRDDSSGFSFQECEIRATSDLAPVKGTVKTYLGRPWGVFSRVVFMDCFIDDLVDPAGWFPWGSDTRRQSTVYYGEYKNKGPGASTSGRVPWKGFKVITDTKEAENFTVGKLLYPDTWIKSTGIPCDEGLR